MRVFIYEYTCAERTPISTALQAEGAAMLAAVMSDFSSVPGVEAATIVHATGTFHGAGTVQRSPRGKEAEAFRDLSRWADFTLVIAPECDGILGARVRWVEESAGRLLCPNASAVALAADKLLLAQHLQGHGVATPECRPFRRPEDAASLPYPLVWKPRFGAGAQATFLLGKPADWEGCLLEARREGFPEESLLQRFIPGLPASVAVLIGAPEPVPLLPTVQRLSPDGRFHYLGGSLPLPRDLAERAVRLALSAVRCVPGLLGYVGVDLVLGETDSVIEINPRLTTSYVGLRALAETNLAWAMLQAAQGLDVGELRWRRGSVRFQADGKVETG